MKCFLFSLFSWKFEGADIVMEWVAVIGSVCAVFMLIIEMLESSYRKKSCKGIIKTSKKKSEMKKKN